MLIVDQILSQKQLAANKNTYSVFVFVEVEIHLQYRQKLVVFSQA